MLREFCIIITSVMACIVPSLPYIPAKRVWRNDAINCRTQRAFLVSSYTFPINAGRCSPKSPRPQDPKIKLAESIYQETSKDESSCTRSMSAEDETAVALKFSKLRSLGIDYGLSRTGLAVTAGGYHPRPLAILSGHTQTLHGDQVRYNNTKLCNAIVAYAVSERVSNLVIGLPLHKNGSVSDQSIITRQFAVELLECVRRERGRSLDVTLWDERYTSKEAASRIVGEAMARNKRVSVADLLLDDEAACIILEHYYQILGRDAESVKVDAMVEEEWVKEYQRKLEQERNKRRELMDSRSKLVNARREMIERSKILETVGGVCFDKKKRKKKR